MNRKPIKAVKELEPGGKYNPDPDPDLSQSVGRRNGQAAQAVIPRGDHPLPLAESRPAKMPRSFKEDIYEVELLGHKVIVAQMWIPMRKLTVDDAYQRPINESRARRYAVEWNQALAGLITVSSRTDGTYAVLDGQHRARGAQIRRLPEVWAEVYFDLTPELEAYMFRERNRKRVATSSLDDFRAAVAAGDPQALRVLHVLDELGLQVGSNSKQPKTYACIAALFTLDTWGVLHQALSLIRETWPDNPRAKEQPIVLGVGLFLWNYRGEITGERFVKVMADANLVRWLNDAATLKVSLGKRAFEHLARLITVAWNKGLQHKLPEDGVKLPPRGRSNEASITSTSPTRVARLSNVPRST